MRGDYEGGRRAGGDVADRSNRGGETKEERNQVTFRTGRIRRKRPGRHLGKLASTLENLTRLLFPTGRIGRPPPRRDYRSHRPHDPPRVDPDMDPLHARSRLPTRSARAQNGGDRGPIVSEIPADCLPPLARADRATPKEPSQTESPPPPRSQNQLPQRLGVDIRLAGQARRDGAEHENTDLGKPLIEHLIDESHPNAARNTGRTRCAERRSGARPRAPSTTTAGPITENEAVVADPTRHAIDVIASRIAGPTGRPRNPAAHAIPSADREHRDGGDQESGARKASVEGRPRRRSSHSSERLGGPGIELPPATRLATRGTNSLRSPASREGGSRASAPEGR